MLRVVLSLACCVVIAASAGCSAIVSPDPARFDETDGGRVMLVDSGTPSGEDAGPTPDVDAGSPGDDGGTPAADAGPPPVDAGPACIGEPRCEGEVRISCAEGVEVREDCAGEGKLCEAGTCQERACEPGSRECSLDRRSVRVCDERGASFSDEPCAFVCSDATAMCLLDPGPACAGLPAITVGGTQRFTLCGRADANTYVEQAGSDCNPAQRADSGEAIFALTIATRGTYLIDLRDFDNTRSVDTVVYLRRACDEPTTQIACDDDVPCNESDVGVGACTGTVQRRQSRILMTLDPGTYYVVADAFVYSSGAGTFQCGTVELRVRQR